MTRVVPALVSMALVASVPAAARAQADGSTPLMLAIDRGEEDAAARLVRSNANVNAANEYGATALWVAAASGNASMVKLLLDAHANPNAALLSGETPLMTAIDNGNADTAALLIAHGADVNVRESSAGQTALMWAVADRAPTLVKLLLGHRADPHARSMRGFTPLLFAAQQGDVDSGRLLLEAGADVDDRGTADRKTALIIAAASGHTAFAGLLLDAGANPDLSDEAGFTAMHYAALDARGAGIVRALLAHHANPNPRTTKDSREYAYAGVNLAGATPLFFAASRGNVEAVRTLLAGGADPFMKTEKGTPPLVVATWGGSPYAGDWTEEEKQNLLAVTQLLVERGADVNATGEHAWTPLHGAAYKGMDAVAQFLVEHGARLEVFDEYGQTPLSIANAVITVGSKDAYYQSSRVVRKSTADLLVKLGAKRLAESGVQILELFDRR